MDRAPGTDQRDGEPRQDGRISCTIDAQPQAEDQDRIGDGGRDGAKQRRVHGAACIADGAQHARQRHAGRKQDIGRQGDQQEMIGDRQRLAACAQQGEEIAAEGNGKERGRRRDDAGLHEARGREPLRPRAVSGTQRAGDQRADGDGEPDVDRDEEEQDLRRKTDARRQLFIMQPRDVEKRQEIDEENRDKADRACRCHHQHMLQDRPFSEDCARTHPRLTLDLLVHQALSLARTSARSSPRRRRSSIRSDKVSPSQCKTDPNVSRTRSSPPAEIIPARAAGRDGVDAVIGAHVDARQREVRLIELRPFASSLRGA